MILFAEINRFHTLVIGKFAITEAGGAGGGGEKKLKKKNEKKEN